MNSIIGFFISLAVTLCLLALLTFISMFIGLTILKIFSKENKMDNLDSQKIYNDGYDAGYEDGYETGYNDGYHECDDENQESEKKELREIISALIDELGKPIPYKIRDMLRESRIFTESEIESMRHSV